MRVKMLSSRVGVDVTFDGGGEYDLPEERAARWIEAGFATAVESPISAPIEIAVSATVAEVAVVEPVIEAAVAAPPPSRRGRRR